uniref:Uncharacterized protein n=1 Tax=Anopheles arabiensis TaxID=7173 RepID=A0A1Y9GLX9_ANOAR
MASKQMFAPAGCDACNVEDANFQCFTCGTYYCGVSCQMSHWPLHKDLCIPRLVMATPPRENSSLLTQNALSTNAKTLSAAPNLVKIPKPVTNGVAMTKMLPDLQTRKDNNGPVTNGVAAKKTALDVETVKDNIPAGAVSNREKPAINAIKAPLQAPKPSQPAEAVANNENPAPKPLKTPLQVLNALQSGEISVVKGKIVPKIEPPRTPKPLQRGPFPAPGRHVKISFVGKDMLYIYDSGLGPNGEPNSFEMLISRTLDCAMHVTDCLSAPPVIEEIVFAPFEDDYYRSVVKSVQNGIAEVFFPDFGNSMKIEWKKLKEIPDEKLKYAEVVTHPVWIDNVKSFTPRVNEYLETIVDLHEFVLTTVIDMPSTHIRMVDMRHSIQQYVLSEKLLALQQPESSLNLKTKLVAQLRQPNSALKLVATNPNTYKPVYYSEMIDTNISVSKGVELVVSYALHAFNENKISVINKSNQVAYEKTTKDCQTYGQIDPNPYNPQKQEVCLVKVKDIWHRAAPVNFKYGKPVQFYLLDLPAFTDEIKDAPVRRYPPGLTRHLFAVESIVENPEFLLQAIHGDENKVEQLPGVTIRANVYQTIEDDIIHLNVVSYEKGSLYAL